MVFVSSGDDGVALIGFEVLERMFLDCYLTTQHNSIIIVDVL